MFDQLLGGLQYNMDELIGREEEEEVAHTRKTPPLLTSRCNMTAKVSPQEPLV